MNKKKLIIGLSILAVFTVFIVIGVLNSDQLAASATKVTLTVNTDDAATREIVSQITVKGSIKPIKEEKVYSSTLAQVDTLNIDAGDQVKKDDILLTFNDTEYTQLLSQLEQSEKNLLIQDESLVDSNQRDQEALNQAKQLVDQMSIAREQTERNLETAINDHENSLQLFAAGAISSEQLDASEDNITSLKEKLQLDITAWDNAKVSYNNLLASGQNTSVIQRDIQSLQTEDLANRVEDYDLEILSPINGTVLSVSVEEGSMVNQTVPVVEVADLSNFIVEAYVSEFNGPSLQIGQTATIKTRSLSPIEFNGEITYISPLAENDPTSNSATKAVKVEITLTDYDASGENLLKPGYTVDTTITLATKEDAVVVPILSTLKDKEGNYFVYVVDVENMVEKRTIEFGILSDLDVEVAGVEEGESVIINPSSQVKDGMEVIPTPKTEGDESND
ncbi:efflux RND transporter periplasmic adaptor subunit [Vallitalea okinawensis]|uniref:efflux RND transporter periplasmic adaptor subunit n=1 Tax=Vallitalea okinawensis TaxID=2078660 RepID=UPI000CFC9CA1|nr:efflux RND transporter periplasmic adaptor subunit [Vallitalea okinawensis]